jgi:thioesterase domain-containing protein
LRVPQALQTIGRASYLRAAVRYRPGVYPGRITLFRASEQPTGCYPDPLLGWRGLAAGGIEEVDIEGGHADIMSEPRVAILAEHLTSALQQYGGGLG